MAIQDRKLKELCIEFRVYISLGAYHEAREIVSKIEKVLDSDVDLQRIPESIKEEIYRNLYTFENGYEAVMHGRRCIRTALDNMDMIINIL